MPARLLATTLYLNLACVGFAGPHLVRFEGAVTEIADGAPDSFWIGERVSGEFVYDPDAPALLVAHAVSMRPVPTDLSISPPTSIGVQQVWRGSDLAIGTEGGSSYRDASLDLRWLGFGELTLGRFDLSPIPNTNFAAANSGFFANQILALFGEPLVPSTLSTKAGPIASAMQIELAAHEPDFRYDSEGMPVVNLSRFADPSSLVLKSGRLSFDNIASRVSFEIDRFTIVAVPEPSALFLLVAAFVLRTQKRRC